MRPGPPFLLGLMVILSSSCGWSSADEQVITKFFQQSRLYDTTRMANFARVVFDPRVEGVVDRFRITSRSDEELDGNRVRRQATLDTHVRTVGGEYERTLVVTLDRDETGRWMITGYRWSS